MSLLSAKVVHFTVKTITIKSSEWRRRRSRRVNYSSSTTIKITNHLKNQICAISRNEHFPVILDRFRVRSEWKMLWQPENNWKTFCKDSDSESDSYKSSRREKSSHTINGKPARVRTVLNEKQLSMLRATYQMNQRPDALVKEQLVEMTGLSPRVVRVWFQNKRCKDKKKSLELKLQMQQEKASRVKIFIFQFPYFNFLSNRKEKSATWVEFRL